jgi:hypothetical protein
MKVSRSITGLLIAYNIWHFGRKHLSFAKHLKSKEIINNKTIF